MVVKYYRVVNATINVMKIILLFRLVSDFSHATLRHAPPPRYPHDILVYHIYIFNIYT